MLEIERLANMLKEAGIPFERDDEDLRPNRNYYRFHLVYPEFGGHFELYKRVCSVIQGTYTYGGLENRLEIMGLLTEEEAEYDSVCGWLTAEDVFERIKAHWENSK